MAHWVTITPSDNAPDDGTMDINLDWVVAREAGEANDGTPCTWLKFLAEADLLAVKETIAEIWGDA